MRDYIIKDASDNGVPCFQVHDAATDEMVAWCVSMNDAMDYVRFLLTDRYMQRQRKPMENENGKS